MTKQERILLESVASQIEGMEAKEVIEHLLACGVVSMRACERVAIRSAVEKMVGQGVGRCEAMEAVADDFACSYGKVRGVIYNMFKN